MKLLAIGHVWPQPNATAAGEHMMHLLSFFTKMNYDVLFVSAAQKPLEYHTLKNKNIKEKQVLINDAEFDSLLVKYQPEVVLFDRFITEEQFSWRVYKHCPQALRILDTEDLHFLRNQRLNNLKGKEKEIISDIFKREIASIYRSDLSLIISLSEIELLTKTYNIPEQLLDYLPLLSEGKTIPSNSFEERNDFIFVGNFLHLPNWDCVQYLKKHIWPLLSKKLPKAKLHIYGSHASEKHLQLSNPKERFIVHGYTENIEQRLTEAKILLAPLQFGAGQKGKLLKAMENGLPNITTPIGAEGMLFNNNWAGAVCDTADAIITQAETLYSNSTKWQTAQDKCTTILAENFNYENHFKNFQKTITQLQKKLLQHRLNNTVGQVLWHHSLRSTEYMSKWITEKNKTIS